MHTIEGLAAAQDIVRANMTPRAHEIAKLERYVEGTQYEGLKDWFDDAPLNERAPCVVYTAAQSAIRSNVDLILGEGRFPVVTSRPGEDDDEFDDEFGLSEDDSEILDHFSERAFKQARFKVICKAALTAAQGERSTCAIYGVRAGKLFGDTVRARWCTPDLDADGAVLSLTVSYPYVDQYRDEYGKWHARAMRFRRVIDGQRDVTYLPGEATIECREPVWTEDPKATFVHGFGFCPVVWYPFMAGCSVVGTIDGQAIHENQLDEIRAHDVALSTRHRAALYAGDPQWTETGVELGSNPSGTTATGGTPGSAAGGQLTGKDGSNPATTRYVGAKVARSAGRKKHPGQVWQYENENAEIKLHTLAGDALATLDKEAHDLRLKLCEGMCVVILDPENVKYAATLSAVAIESLRARQFDRCDQIRDDFGDKFILPSTDMLLRIALVMSKKPKGSLRLGGLAKIAPILQKFDSEAADVDVA